MKNGFAGRIADTMRANAPAKLRQLKVAHEIGADTDMHDGAAMWLAIEALKLKPSATHQRSADWHEKQWEIMRDTSLPDHCGVQAFLAKVTMLLEKHIPNFQKVRLEGANLADVIINFMPSDLTGEGRTLRREVINEGLARDRALEQAALMSTATQRTAALASANNMPRGLVDYERVLG